MGFRKYWVPASPLLNDMYDKRQGCIRNEDIKPDKMAPSD